jgi:curved DNA-binding protein CbpA
MKNLYDILQVPATATPEQIRRSFRRLSKLHHPDRQGDPERFKEIVAAYSVLSDSQKRNAYDRDRQPQPQPKPKTQPQYWWKNNRTAFLNILFSLLMILSLVYVGYRIKQLGSAPASTSPILVPDLGPSTPFIEKAVDSIELPVETPDITAPPTFLDEGVERDSGGYPHSVENY